MNYNLPPDEGKKKKDLYWNVCIVLGIIAIIAFVVNANQDMDQARGEYINIEGDQWYECANGERFYDLRNRLKITVLRIVPMVQMSGKAIHLLPLPVG